MKKAAFAGAALFAGLILIAGYRRYQRSPAQAPHTEAAPAPAHPSLLYGRIATVDGATYEGRLRWGASQEAFWGNYFNGAKKENPWAVHLPPDRLPKERQPIEIFGIEFGQKEQPANLGRLFMSRFGDIARIEASARDVRVTLKSGATFHLDRFSASDFDDGVRVWDSQRGVADLDTLRIRAIDFLPAPESAAAPERLHGTLHTRRRGAFTGFLQFDREQCLGTDEIEGRRFDSIRSIARRSGDTFVATAPDGSEVVLSDEHARGIYVDDPRYGRVLVSWKAFERVEFSRGAGSGPAYADFPRGGPLTGSVTTRSGRRLSGRLVYDLDESEITETLDAPSDGVDYTVPFGLVASVVLPGAEERARITLHSGEELQLERTGDLGKANSGLLVFPDGAARPEYVPWPDVARIDLARPTAMYPR